MPKEQRSKQTAHWRQLWSCLPPAHHLLCKHLCLFMHILYNVCQFLHLAPTQAFEFYGDLLFFLKKSESRVWQQNALLQKNTQVQEPLRWHLGVAPASIGAWLSLKNGSIPLLCLGIRMSEPWIVRVGIRWCCRSTADISSSHVRCCFLTHNSW